MKSVIPFIVAVMLVAWLFQNCADNRRFEQCHDELWEQGFRGDDLFYLTQACVEQS